MNVRVQHTNFFSFLIQIHRHQIAKRENPGQAPLVEHDQVTHVRLLHPVKADLAELADVGHQQLRGHDVGDRSGRGIEIGRDDSRQDVALRDNPGQLIAVEDRKRANVPGGHQARGFPRTRRAAHRDNLAFADDRAHGLHTNSGPVRLLV